MKKLGITISLVLLIRSELGDLFPPANVDQIRQLIAEDGHLTVRVLAQLTEMNKGSVHTILHGNLYLRCVYSVWVRITNS